MIKKISFFQLVIFFYFFLICLSQADIKNELINKYKSVNTLHFDFTQKVGEKVEYGYCYIKYPLQMRCEYPKKKKSIITNGKKFAIVKRRYKKIYYYPLKKTPLFFLLKKENILNLITKYEPLITNSEIIKYEFIDVNSNKLNIFFDKKTLQLAGWETIDSYSNNVGFFIKNLKTNILIKNEFFIIPRVEDL